MTTDAFRSADGPYGGQNIIDDGNIGVNGVFAMGAKMNVGGSLIVSTGDVVIPGTSDIKKDLCAFGAARHRRRVLCTLHGRHPV